MGLCVKEEDVATYGALSLCGSAGGFTSVARSIDINPLGARTSVDSDSCKRFGEILSHAEPWPQAYISSPLEPLQRPEE